MSDEHAGRCSCSGSSPTAAVAGAPPTEPARPAVSATTRTRVRIPGMDCPSEEQMIRLRLADAPVATMQFDLPGRLLVLDHMGDPADLLARLVPLGYGAELESSFPLGADQEPLATADDATEARVLWTLLAINAAMFVVEVVAGWWARSTGLISDAADMFADAAVYGVALYAVGRAARYKLAAARLSGLLQLALGAGALAEACRRIFMGSAPEGMAMIGISILALAANVACLLLISKHRDGGVHMRASYIFSANDVLANLGVIVAGGLVALTANPWPDWIIGLAIGLMVLTGAIRILRLK